MAYELSDEKNLKKVLGVATYAGARLLTGSPDAASFLKDKVEKTRDFFSDGSDRSTISDIIEDIIGKSWEFAISGYELPIECRRELAQYNIMENLDAWASIPTIRYNIARICSNYNVSLNTIDTGDIARKLLRCIVARVEDDPFLKTRDSLREIINNTEKANEKLDMILDILNTGKGNDPKLYGRLMERFINRRSEHPSIKMMTPDPSLFPIGIHAITSSDRTAVEGDQKPLSIKEMILNSWKEHKNKHILLVGEGGIGKTVAMLTIPIEEWIRPYNIPAIYIPLNQLENYAGSLNEYINNNYINDINGINERANSSWEEHPNLLLLLDGFNEISMKFRSTAERHICEWMEKPGVQIITTSRISMFLDNDFQEYILQPLPDETVRNYLVASGIDQNNLPSESDNVWKVINVPLMMVIYLQIDKVKERTDRGYGYKYLEWRDSDNAAHIIWNYLQVELYRHISVLKTDSVLSVASIFAVAPYICFEMVNSGKFRVEQEEFKGLIGKALQFFNHDQVAIPEQIDNIVYRFDKNSEDRPFDDNSLAAHFSILIDQSALFQTIDEKEDGKLIIYYVPSHQNFRDALAAIFISTYLLNICKPDSGQSISEKIFDAADYYVKDFISEFLSDDKLIDIWTYHRKNEPENGRITWILIDIIGRKRNYDFSELDFSGLDLTKTKLHRHISKRTDICPLPQKAELFAGTKIRMKSFLPEGHTGPVNSVSYSPDGRHLASGSSDRTVRIWNLESGDAWVLKGHTGPVNSVSYSPDGRQLASGSSDGTIRIWDLKSRDYRILKGHTDPVYSVSYSPDGRHLASGSSDRTVRIWDLRSGNDRILESLKYQIMCVTYRLEESNLACLTFDGTIHIWNFKSGEKRVIEGHRSVSYSLDGRHLHLASGSEGTVRILDIESKDAWVLDGHTASVLSVVFSPNRKYLASGSSDGTIRIWNLESRDCRVLESHTGSIRNLAYSIDGRHLASGANDGTIYIWDLESGKYRVLHGNRWEGILVAFNPNGKNVASRSSDGTIRVWDLKNGESYINSEAKNATAGPAYSPDGKYVASGSTDGKIYVWNPKSRENCVLEAHKEDVNNIVYSPDGRLLVSGSTEGIVRIWNLKSGKNHVLEDHLGDYFDVIYSPDGTHIVISSPDGILCTWDLISGERYLLNENKKLYCLDCSPDGKNIAYVLSDGAINIWEIKSEEICILENSLSSPLDLAYSPDGRHIAFRSWNGEIYILNLESLEIRLLEGNTDDLNDVVYSPDGRFLASGSEDGKINIWDIESGKSQALEGHIGFVNNVVYSPDGNLLASGSEDGTVRIWDILNNSSIGVFRIIPGIYLNGINLEQAILSEEEKEMFRECGAKV